MRKSTIRTTKKGLHQALVMESDHGNYYVAISKAQGCDDAKVRDSNFIGWVRRYDGPFQAEAWDLLDNDVDEFYQEECGKDKDDCQETSNDALDEETLKNLWKWQMLMMRPRKNDKGKWSFVYMSHVDGEDYTLLNKGVRWMQTGLLKEWNPPRAKLSLIHI